MKHSMIVRLHEYAAANSDKVATRDELLKVLGLDPEINPNSDEMLLADTVINEVYSPSPINSRMLRIRSEAYYRHLDYIEMKEARKSTTEARWYAIIAIVIAILTGIAQIIATLAVG